LLLFAATSAAASAPFFVGCHSRATVGKRIANEFFEVTILPEHSGHPLPWVVRLATVELQTWSGFFKHCQKAL
jgi:hypothetical protein